MNLITKNNYEAYLLDYVEKNLSPELIAELMLFLENNPDLKEELENYEKMELVAPIIQLENKSKLKKEENLINLNNYENFIIQEIEGENTVEISAALHLFLEKNPNRQADFIAFQKTKLIAPIIIFNDKKSLKKKEGIIVPMYWWYSSAAAVIIILFLLNGFNNSEENKVQPIANTIEIKTPIKNDKNIKEKIIEEKKKENKLANVAIKKSSNSLIEKKEVKEKVPQIINYIKEESPKVFAENPIPSLNSTKDSLPNNNVTEEVLEEINYADNVKITFDVEPVTKAKEPERKFKTVGQTLTKRFLKQDKDENGEVVAYAINVGDFTFSRNKRKK